MATPTTKIIVTRSSGGGNGLVLSAEQEGTPLTEDEIKELAVILRYDTYTHANQSLKRF